MTKTALQERVRRELIEYGINVLYLAIVFAAFTQYRRLLLASYDITYTNYFVAVIEALVLGKVLMIGSLLRLARGMETRPLIYPTLYKAVAFSVLVGVFKLIEHGIKGMLGGRGFLGGIRDVTLDRVNEMLANSLVVFVALIPFFAFRELSRVLGGKKIRELFFTGHAGR
jgi:hypothetical protein